MRLSRVATLVWAIVLFGLAIISLLHGGRVVEVGLRIASVAYGALLGVFLLGVLTRSANQRGAMAGMIVGFVIEMYLWLGTRVPWTWWVMIGTCVTFVFGWIVSRFASDKAKHCGLTLTFADVLPLEVLFLPRTSVFLPCLSVEHRPERP